MIRLYSINEFESETHGKAKLPKDLSNSTEGQIKDRKRIFTPLLFSLHQIIKIRIGIVVRINTASNIVTKAILGDVPIFCDIQKIEIVLNTKPHINPIFIASL
tara:strand:+ start:88 stop:396 length:309 start_codon:yes stop_codon:yes gene_type:complete